MVNTIDRLARTALDGATNVEFIGDTTASGVVAGDVLTAAMVRKAHAELSAADAQPLGNGAFAAEVHPHASYDLKDETGDGAWVSPAQYVDTIKIYNNEIGMFGGFRFMETSRASLVANGASSNVDLYTSYFHGKDALGEAVSIPPHIVIGPVVDKLKRMQPLGWYGYLGFDTIREAAVRLKKHASSIGTN
jgi:N4-gp56 family major capsid protein